MPSREGGSHWSHWKWADLLSTQIKKHFIILQANPFHLNLTHFKPKICSPIFLRINSTNPFSSLPPPLEALIFTLHAWWWRRNGFKFSSTMWLVVKIKCLTWTSLFFKLYKAINWAHCWTKACSFAARDDSSLWFMGHLNKFGNLQEHAFLIGNICNHRQYILSNPSNALSDHKITQENYGSAAQNWGKIILKNPKNNTAPSTYHWEAPANCSTSHNPHW